MKASTGLATVLLLSVAVPLLAERTDVVVLSNGDRITGEVKKLERGWLKYKTDDMKTIYIEWGKIEQITSKEHFQVEVDTGERYFGTLAPTDEEGTMAVIGEQETFALGHSSVVGIAPIKEKFLGRIDGSLDLGISFLQANDETQLSLNLEANYRSRSREETLKLDSVLTSREGVEDTERATLGFSHFKFMKKMKKGLLWGSAQLERNSELGLDLRSLVGGGPGLRLIQTNRTLLTLVGGLAVAREDPSGSEPSRSSTEAVLGLHYSTFASDYPNTQVSVVLVVLPSLSESGRVRMDLDASVRREIVKDFYLNLSLFDSFDSEPLEEEAAEHDWGVITSIGWSF